MTNLDGFVFKEFSRSYDISQKVIFCLGWPSKFMYMYTTCILFILHDLNKTCKCLVLALLLPKSTSCDGKGITRYLIKALFIFTSLFRYQFL